MNRKQFLITSSLAAFSMSAFGAVSKTKNGNFEGDCTTTNDILGPFYRPDAPESSDMLFEGLEGNRITVKGTVFTDDCVTPIKNVLVEIWHCNTKGEYDNESSKFRHRAVLHTNKNGEYSFHTIMPGKYLNGKLYRPAHIHFRVTEDSHKELISQVYFKGDPHITEDPWASQEKAIHRVLPVTPEDVKGGLAINFDIFLDKK
jgi:protocatechuate 3,4-dioxygenase beta subunit